jgi:predicted NBD/HSP70 family sugar kinase
MSQKTPDQARAEANAAIIKAKGVIDSATKALNQLVSTLIPLK